VGGLSLENITKDCWVFFPCIGDEVKIPPTLSVLVKEGISHLLY
jgi:hypothetical protein